MRIRDRPRPRHRGDPVLSGIILAARRARAGGADATGGGRIRVAGFVRDTGATLGAEVVVLASGLLFYAIIARWFGADGVGAAALVKRSAGVLAPIVFLGLQTGLPRMIAVAQRDPELRSGYAVSGVLALAVMLALAAAPLLLLPGPTAAILLGGSRYGYLQLAGFLTLASLLAYGTVRGILFGLLRIPVASVTQVLAVGVAPIVAILAWHSSVSAALIAAAAGTIVVALAGSLPFLAPAVRGFNSSSIPRAAPGLLAYSLPRMPGDLAMAALMSIGTLWAARFADLHTAGYLSVSQSLLSAITAAFVPLSVVLLPRAAALIAAGRREEISSRVSELTSLTLLGSGFVAVQGAVLASTLLYWWLGPAFAAGAPILQITMLGVPFLALFFSLRGLVDAITSRPYHTYNLFIALAVGIAGFVTSSAVLPRGSTALGIATSGFVALVVLAALTVRITGRLYGTGFSTALWLPPLLRNLVAGALALAVHHYLLPGTDPVGLAALLLFEALLAAVTFYPVLSTVRRNRGLFGGSGTAA